MSTPRTWAATSGRADVLVMTDGAVRREDPGRWDGPPKDGQGDAPQPRTVGRRPPARAGRGAPPPGRAVCDNRDGRRRGVAARVGRPGRAGPRGRGPVLAGLRVRQHPELPFRPVPRAEGD